jgi:hypothetical protein
MLKPELSHLRNFVVALFVMFVSAGGGLIQSQEPEKLLPLAEETELFNGTDLNGWLFFTKNDTVKVEDVWTVADGVLKCTGKPAGYLQTKLWYRDYELELQWRWPGEKGGNSGVLVHTSTPLLFYGWPKSMEVQLQAKAAGDFWVICEGVDIRVEDEANRRPKPKAGDQHSHRRIKRLAGEFENPVGEWNKMKVICRADAVQVFVNDKLVNEGTACTVTEGAIALQSEGTPIEFKQIRIKPLVKNETAAENRP